MVTQKRILAICIVVFCLACVEEDRALLSEAEQKRFEEAAGSGWTIHAEDDAVVITSMRPFWFYNGVSLPYMTEGELEAYILESGRKDYYEITLRFVRQWTEEEIDVAGKTNEAIYREIGGLREKHGLGHLTPNKEYSFFPETEADKEKIESYERDRDLLESRLIDIPVFKSEFHSVYITDNRMGFEAVWSDETPLIDFSVIFEHH